MMIANLFVLAWLGVNVFFVALRLYLASVTVGTGVDARGNDRLKLVSMV